MPTSNGNSPFGGSGLSAPHFKNRPYPVVSGWRWRWILAAAIIAVASAFIAWGVWWAERGTPTIGDVTDLTGERGPTNVMPDPDRP